MTKHYADVPHALPLIIEPLVDSVDMFQAAVDLKEDCGRPHTLGAPVFCSSGVGGCRASYRVE
jgi:hypothetical protein